MHILMKQIIPVLCFIKDSFGSSRNNRPDWLITVILYRMCSTPLLDVSHREIGSTAADSPP